MRAALAALLLGAGLSTTALAQAPLRPAPSAAEQKAFDKQEAKDRKVVEKALNASSLAQMASQAPALEAVVSRAPAYWPMVEHRAGETIVRLNDKSSTLMVLLMAAGAPAEGKTSASGSTVATFNTYGMAAFLRGSLAVEARQPEEALRWLDKGLSFQPDNLMLVTEKGSAMVLQGRFAEALALYDAFPERDGLLAMSDPTGEARLQRARGFSLTELNRLDEAEAAYKASLELEPDHGGAKAELAYIQKLRGGAARQAAEVFTGEEAKARRPD